MVSWPETGWGGGIFCVISLMVDPQSSLGLAVSAVLCLLSSSSQAQPCSANSGAAQL